MNKNKELGSKGESAALRYLTSRGFKIRTINYTNNRREIDIIGEKDGILVFFEVKTRRNFKYGQPEEAIDDKKIKHILECANDYIHEIDWEGQIRFDIITVIASEGTKITHIKDAFL